MAGDKSMIWSLCMAEWKKQSNLGNIPNLTDTGLGDIAKMFRSESKITLRFMAS